MRARVVGPLTGDALATAYASADLFCLPSVTETLGQVVLEAAATGLPTVVMDKGGATELVQDGRTGLVASAAEPDGLARALARLADDPVLRTRLGQRARAVMLGWPTWDEVFTGLADGYREVRDEGRSAPAPRPSAWPTFA